MSLQERENREPLLPEFDGRITGRGWVWESRWSHLHLRDVSAGSGFVSDIMEPTFFRAKGEAEIRRQVEALKEANINAILTEGVRHLINYELGGKTEEVIATIRRVTEVCHEAGIKVIHHTTTTFAGHQVREFSEDQQAWLSMDAQTGQPSFVNWEGGWHLWCINNPAFRAEYFRLCRKVVSETGVDGLMTDEVYFRANGWYTCACRHCQAQFHSASGLSLPLGDVSGFWGHFDNADFRAWLRFRSDSVGNFYADLSQELKKVHPNPVFLGCSNHEEDPAQTAMFGDSNQGRMRGANLLFLELYEGPVASVLYSWRRMSASFLASNGLTNYYRTPTMSLMVIPNFQEAFLGWALQSAHGNRIWVTGPRCLAADLPPAECSLYGELFDWEKRHQAELNGAVQPLAEIGVLFSASTRNLMMAHWGATEPAPVSNGDWGDVWFDYAKEWAGWCETLNDEFLQYAVPTEQEISGDILRRYALIILPDTTCLSDAACQELLDYVAGGGTLISTGKTGACDETGTICSTNRLQDLGILTASSLAETGETIGSHEVVYGKYKMGRWVHFRGRPGEATYLDSNKLGKPRGKGGANGRQFSEEVRQSQRALMVEAVRWAAGTGQTLTVRQAPEGVLIKAFQKPESGARPILVHFLNCLGEKAVAFGEDIPETYNVEYPPLQEEIVLELAQDKIDQAYVFSPDWPGRQPVKIEPADAGFRVTISPDLMKRYTVLYLEVDGALSSAQ